MLVIPTQETEFDQESHHEDIPDTQKQEGRKDNTYAGKRIVFRLPERRTHSGLRHESPFPSYRAASDAAYFHPKGECNETGYTHEPNSEGSN